MAEAKRQSALVAALRSRPRWHIDVDVSGFFDRKGEPLPKIRFRVLTKAEENKALAAAHVEAARLLKGHDAAAAAAREDPDLMVSLKACEALYEACRDPDNDMYPAFETPEAMRQLLTTDQIATLLNIYNSCKQALRPIPEDDDLNERIDALREACARNIDSDVPEVVLAAYRREELAMLFVLAMRRWQDEREARAAGYSDDELAAAAAAAKAAPLPEGVQ